MSKNTDTAAVRADLDQARTELGDTVQALATEADVPTRAKQAVVAVKDRTVDTARSAADTVRQRPVPVATGAVAVLATVAGAVVFLVVRRRRATRPRRMMDRWLPGRR